MSTLASGLAGAMRRHAMAACAFAVLDALRHLDVTHIDITITPEKAWRVLKATGAAL